MAVVAGEARGAVGGPRRGGGEAGQRCHATPPLLTHVGVAATASLAVTMAGGNDGGGGGRAAAHVALAACAGLCGPSHGRGRRY